MSHIAGLCRTPYGSSALEQYSPIFDRDLIELRQSEIAQMKDIINFGKAFPLSRMEDCREILEKTRVEGSFLDPSEIRIVLELVEVSLDINGYDKEEREKCPAIDTHIKRIRAFPDLKKDIDRAIDVDGTIKDSASSKLKEIRADLADSRRRIVAKLGAILGSQPKQSGWQDDVITQRNGRYVIPVVAGQYRANEGILHDRSQSGATFYVEPNATVELNNSVNLFTQDEQIEINRILRALTGEIRERLEALVENTHVIGQLDAIHAAAAFAVETDSNKPTMVPEARFDLLNARHPLLILKFGSKDKVVPLTLHLDDDRRAILVTGPNTGGKTIALKTVGLLVIMAQSGLLIPADETSTVGIFDQIFADIGDEQSIELSLSTFSSHINNICRAVARVSPTTLVLFDEVGAGTDPKEGAALAEAIILYIIDRDARMIVTTHYSQLKTLALERPEIVNASLEFNRKNLAPTYRMQIGLPGSSFAVEIAGRLGMPDEICARATSLLGSGERSLSELIAAVESELAQIRSDKVKLTERLEKAEELERHYREQSEKFKTQIDETKKQALAETDRLLDITRRETEKLVADIRKSQADGKAVKKMHAFLKEQKQTSQNIQSKMKQDEPPESPADEFAAGDAVMIISLNQEGEVQEVLDDERARVRVGSMITIVKLRNLEKLTRKPQRPTYRIQGAGPDISDVSPEIHLRGMTVEEATESLDRGLDRALVAGLSQVYVIHGKGTGTLRRILTTYLRKHPDVESIRLGDWNEGGAGVTIVKLKP